MSGYVTSVRDTAGFYRADPELALMLPKKPRMINELKMLPFRDDDLLVVGSYTMQVFKGKGARSLLPKLQPYLTGEHEIDELEQQVPPELRGRVFDIVTLLANKGLLEDGPATDTGGLASFLGRYVGAGRNFNSRQAALQHLQQHKLAVFTDASYIEQLQQMLADLPVASQQFASHANAIADLDATVVLLVEGPNFQQQQTLCQQLRERGIVVFYCALGSGSVCIGPLFDGKLSVSYQSVQERIRPDLQAGLQGAEQTFWLGAICHELTLYLAKVSQQTVFNVCKKYGLGQQVEGSSVKVCPMPGVADGALAHLPRLQHERAETLWDLHNSFRMPPKAYIGEAFHLQHYKASNRSLTATKKPRFYSSITYPLPAAQALPRHFAVQNQDKAMSLQQLADLLTYSYGYQQVDGQPRLIPPTGGGLSSPEAYVVIQQLEGIPDGRYHYDARNHTLEFLGDLNVDLFASMLQQPNLPQVLVFGVASLQRVRAKYGNSSFKITNLDAGVAQTYLRQIALRLGVAQQQYHDWFSVGLMDELSIPHRENRFVLTHVFGLGQTIQTARFSDDMIDHFIAMRPQRRALTWQEPTDRVPTLASFDLGEVIKRRRAVRDFASKAANVSDIEQLLADSWSLSAALEQQHGSRLPLNFWVLLRYDSPDHAAGLYRYEPSSASLQPVYLEKDIDFTRFANQTSLTDAGALILFTADLYDILNREEDYGYRQLWQHTGQLAGDLWLRSCAAGFVGTIAGGALDEALLTYAQTDGMTDAVLALFALGEPKGAE